MSGRGLSVSALEQGGLLISNTLDEAAAFQTRLPVANLEAAFWVQALNTYSRKF